MKKTLSLILVIVLCMLLVACGDVEITKPAEDSKETSRVGGNISIKPTEDDTTESAPEEEPAPKIEVKGVAIGEKIVTEFVEMTFDKVVVDENIKHSVKIGHVTRTTGPDPIAGQKYVCLSGTIKNISTSPLPVYDFFIGEFELDGYKYEVDANDCDILDGSGQTETEIDPLMEYVIRIYVAIPNSLADSHSSCTLYFGFYDAFDNKELSRNKAFEEEPIPLCPYQCKVTLK